MSINQFIATQLESVDHLRVLLHLKSTPRTEWDVLDVAAKLYLPPSRAGIVLADLERRGLAVSQGEPVRYRYQPKSPELTELVEQLAELDRTHPVTLINAIYGHLEDIQAFADAFKLKRDKKH